MNEVLNFINDKTRILLIISENQLEEIASLAHCGKLKANQIIKELIEEGYLEMIHAKGRYLITAKGYVLLEKMSLFEN